ncbi:ABC transporter substrate-binding protein [Paenibacillus chibensis]|uniref:ABC transporter substrate-binding protein n=1 Tax=Paenibacillus chibensis TaxID=59846 RepID=UPI000FDB7AC1|nr:ABC transporter substrate-binding protein [Paenibacillus chibensis]MEC0369767.1 ABC transporter substrate-binding protein [Paenibacillus chibensis]
MAKHRGFKFMALGLALATMLTACAKTGSGPAGDPGSSTTGSEGASKVKITYWTPFSGGDGEFMDAMVKKFNEENGSIQVETLNNKSEDYYTKLQTSLASDQAPDVAVVHSARLPQFVPSGYLTDLDTLASENGVKWEDFNPTILDSTVYDGKHYSLPLDTHAIVMYYNKKYLEQAGVLKDGKPDLASSPEGFTDFLTKIQKAVPSDVAPLAQPNVRVDSYWVFWGLYNQISGGGTFYKEDGTAGLNNPQALKALEYVDSLYKSKLIPPNIDDAFKMFQDGKAAVLLTGVWGVGSFEKTQGLDFGVVPMPQLYDQPATWGDSHTLALPKHAKEDPEKQKAAITFANWIVQHGEMWAQAGHIPSVSKVLDSDAFKSMKFRSDYSATADFVKYWPRNPKQGQINDEVTKEFEKMMMNKQDAKTTLENADKAINKVLGK